jgi:hypothetical protein
MPVPPTRRANISDFGIGLEKGVRYARMPGYERVSGFGSGLLIEVGGGEVRQIHVVPLVLAQGALEYKQLLPYTLLPHTIRVLTRPALLSANPGAVQLTACRLRVGMLTLSAAARR